MGRLGREFLERWKLGDKVERAVKPVAVALRLPCLDEQKRLKPGCGCAKRRDALNGVQPLPQGVKVNAHDLP